MEAQNSLPAKIAFIFVILAIICFVCKEAFSSESEIKTHSFNSERARLIKAGCNRHHRKTRQQRCLKWKMAELNANRQEAR